MSDGEKKREAKPSTSKQKDPATDFASTKFCPLTVIYGTALPDAPRVVKTYDNLAAFQAELGRMGVEGLARLQGVKPSTSAKSKQETPQPPPSDTSDKYLNIPNRRFLAHQAPIPTTGLNVRHTRSLFSKLNDFTGPLASLRLYMETQRRVKIFTRKEKGIRGYTTGIVGIFDKNWNILLEDACEVWNRKKFKFSDNNVCSGLAKDCSQRLAKLGIKLPAVEAKSRDRKYVECTRRCKQLMIRGDQIVLISVMDGDDTEKNAEKKA